MGKNRVGVVPETVPVEVYGPGNTWPGSVQVIVNETDSCDPWVDEEKAFGIIITLVWLGETVILGKIVILLPLAVISVTLVISMGYPTKSPTEKANPPLFVNAADETGVFANPVTVVDSDDEGEKIPKEYRTAATMTMTSMLQPYVIMYSNADWDLRGGLI